MVRENVGPSGFGPGGVRFAGSVGTGGVGGSRHEWSVPRNDVEPEATGAPCRFEEMNRKQCAKIRQLEVVNQRLANCLKENRNATVSIYDESRVIVEQRDVLAAKESKMREQITRLREELDRVGEAETRRETVWEDCKRVHRHNNQLLKSHSQAMGELKRQEKEEKNLRAKMYVLEGELSESAESRQTLGRMLRSKETSLDLLRHALKDSEKEVQKLRKERAELRGMLANRQVEAAEQEIWLRTAHEENARLLSTLYAATTKQAEQREIQQPKRVAPQRVIEVGDRVYDLAAYRTMHELEARALPNQELASLRQQNASLISQLQQSVDRLQSAVTVFDHRAQSAHPAGWTAKFSHTQTHTSQTQ